MTQTEEKYSFKSLAKKILKAQKKLGALKGLKATTLTLSESRKRNLKQAGLYSAAGISAAALAAAGIALANRRGKKLPNGRKDVTPRKFTKKDALIAGAVATPAAAAGIGGGILAASKRQTFLIEAKYAYGTKLFEASALSQEDLENGVDKKILREITAAVARLKNEKDWAVKESASMEFLKMATVAEALVEEVMYAEMLEAEALEEGYIFEDEDLEEGYIFEDEDLEEEFLFEEDEDLEEGYIFEDEDLEEEFLFEDEDEEDDEDELAEAYIFED